MKEILYTVYAAGVITGVLATIWYKRLDKGNSEAVKRFYQGLSKQQRTLLYDAFKYGHTDKEQRAIELMTHEQRSAYSAFTLHRLNLLRDLVINYETTYFNA
jgi:hypothetical protein